MTVTVGAQSPSAQDYRICLPPVERFILGRTPETCSDDLKVGKAGASTPTKPSNINHLGGENLTEMRNAKGTGTETREVIRQFSEEGKRNAVGLGVPHFDMDNLSRRLCVPTHSAPFVVDDVGYPPARQDGAMRFFQFINTWYRRVLPDRDRTSAAPSP